ncbi:hypothetical protein BaRGS_00013578 [Batillaria attramentaria]|uniref:Solute carrier family 40 protein n=1 Tax=Batillaria attramentaria TaxID=370345 RepID=A0ABD0L7B4_9CAEN
MSEEGELDPLSSVCIPYIHNMSEEGELDPLSSVCIPYIHNMSEEGELGPLSSTLGPSLQYKLAIRSLISLSNQAGALFLSLLWSLAGNPAAYSCLLLVVATLAFFHERVPAREEISQK